MYRYGGMTKRSVMRFGLVLLFATLSTVSALAMESEGYASWYGPYFQGRATADGEVFNTNKFTAAHKSLPFGSIVKVTNLENNLSVVVRINDRGPYFGNRIIDLTHAAAQALDMIGPGVAKVRIEVLHRQQEISLRTIQVAAFGLRNNAVQVELQLKDVGLSAKVENGTDGVFRVVVPGVPLPEVPNLQNVLRNIGYPDTLVRLF